MAKQSHILINTQKQVLNCFEQGKLCSSYPISTGKNGLGEQQGSECTPRGWHQVHAVLGRYHPANAVFVARQWTGELYTEVLGKRYPERDWILTRIIQLDGLEPGYNRGGEVDTLKRFIYIHGTPDKTKLGAPGSRGCIRMNNSDIILLAEWVSVGAQVCVQ